MDFREKSDHVVSLHPFPTLSSAERVYSGLLARGVDQSQLELRLFDDEAGPTSGNFILEYKGTDVHFDSSWMDMLSSRDDPNVGSGRQEVTWCCEVILLISARDAASLAEVERLRADLS